MRYQKVLALLLMPVRGKFWRISGKIPTKDEIT